MTAAGATLRRKRIVQSCVKAFKRDKYLYLMFLPPLAYFVIFEYVPIYGVTLAFRDFDTSKGILASPWVGLKHFRAFFSNPYSHTVIRNTVVLRLWELAFGFPAPIMLALLLNEVRNERFKGTVQTCSYLPHFISVVVVCGMIVSFLASDGPVNSLVESLGGQPRIWLTRAEWFRPIFTISGVWQSAGWGSVIYLAALTGISPDLYEAAVMDGAGRWQRMRYVTIPGITPTVVIMFLLQIGRILTIGWQKVFLLYTGATYETADVLGTFIYRRGIESADFGFATAAGLVQSLVGLAFIIACNAIARRVGETSLW